MNAQVKTAQQKAAHTPGPWYATGGNVLRDVRGRAMTVAECHVERDDKNRMEELAANANLIAAAPELLDALRGLIETCEHFWSPVTPSQEAALDKARAAIVRAKGGQS